jgi:hypothetical protein
LYQGVEKRAKLTRKTFPQCAFGAASYKGTTFSGNLEELGPFEEAVCDHLTHEEIVGRVEPTDTKSGFKTRRAQSYPPRMCEALARAFILTFVRRGTASKETMDVEEAVMRDAEPEEDLEIPELG